MDQSGSSQSNSLPEHESALRRMMSDASSEPFAPLRSLQEAQGVPDGVVILEGDDGGQIYAVVRAADVRCSELTLQLLLQDLDAQEWNDPSMAHVYYERRPAGSVVAGGRGGGQVMGGLWVHPRLRHLEANIAAILRAERQHL